MYASFGLGAAGGAIAVGSVLSHRPREPIIAVSLALFGLALVGFGLLHNVDPAYLGLLAGGAPEGVSPQPRQDTAADSQPARGGRTQVAGR
jgi:predicted MFS family arabinose efflux permease